LIIQYITNGDVKQYFQLWFVIFHNTTSHLYFPFISLSPIRYRFFISLMFYSFKQGA